ncbi:MAG TPA: response regulator [Candidatus Omnitrophota bacterium]|nr:response regulator [Candidatus Omnitrophota bacterium]HPT06720.1 response regulator [Candidatus Omnitrophota bacterium]
MEKGPSRILVVDNEPDIVETLSLYLRSKGFLVKESLSGKEAIKIMQTERFDIILLDILMPEFRGTEVAKIVRHTFPTTQIIVITAFPDEGAGLYKDNLYDALFIKPLKLDDLHKEIIRLLKKVEFPEIDFFKKEGPFSARDVIIQAKILLLEPSQETFHFLNSQIKQLTAVGQTIELRLATNEKELFEKLSTESPDLVILDQGFFDASDYRLKERIERLGGSSIKDITYLPLNASMHDFNEVEKLIDEIRVLCIKHNLTA